MAYIFTNEGRQAQNLNRAETKIVEETCLVFLACFLPSAQTARYAAQDLLSRDSTPHGTTYLQQLAIKKCLTDMPTGQSGRDNTTIMTPSDNSALCQLTGWLK